MGNGRSSCTIDGENLRAALRAQGFVLLESVFALELMAALRVDLDRARNNEEKQFGLSALQEIGQDGYVSDLLSIGPSIETLLDNDIIHEVLRALMGEAARLYVGQGIILDPGKGRGVWPRCWHADMYQVREAIGDPTFCFGVNCLIIVDDINLENGPTGVLPGSHGLKELSVESEEELNGIEFRAIAPSGSLLLLDGGTWHGANLNRTSKPRRVVKLLFTRQWIRPQIDYSVVTTSEVLERLPDRVKHLLRLAPQA